MVITAHALWSGVDSALAFPSSVIVPEGGELIKVALTKGFIYAWVMSEVGAPITQIVQFTAIPNGEFEMRDGEEYAGTIAPDIGPDLHIFAELM